MCIFTSWINKSANTLCLCLQQKNVERQIKVFSQTVLRCIDESHFFIPRLPCGTTFVDFSWRWYPFKMGSALRWKIHFRIGPLRRKARNILESHLSISIWFVLSKINNKRDDSNFWVNFPYLNGDFPSQLLLFATVSTV